MPRERRQRINKQKEKKKKTARIAAAAVLAVIALIAAANIIYMQAMRGRFYHQTTLNGYDVSGKNAEEVMAVLEEPYSALQLSVTEQGAEVLHTGFTEMGYTIDTDKLRASIENLLERQNSALPMSALFGSKYGIRVPFVTDKTLFQETVSGKQFSVPRVATSDAALIQENGQYVIQPEVYGNDFDDSTLQELVRRTIDEELANGTVDMTITVDIPQEFYSVPKIFQDDEALTAKRDLYNKYCNAEITHTFGEETVTLGWDTIQTWLTGDDASAVIDENAVYNYVAGLAAQYDTLYVQRTFQTSAGNYVTLPNNDYGFAIDIDAEFSQLLSDIYANTATEREPVYAVRGYSRNGVDDLNGSYVEVNLTTQHLWFYKNGELVVETDVVTGLPKDDRETAQGAFAIPYKASPFNLVGGGGGGVSGGWDVMVDYWMPFHDGQGLHDADWRTSFGGNIYTYDGSHGCVNMPPAAAATTYEYMEENMPIILYK